MGEGGLWLFREPPRAEGLAWPLNVIQPALNQLWSFIDDAFAGAVSQLYSFVTDSLKPVHDALAGVSRAVWNVLPEWIRNALNFLGELAGKAWTTLWNFVRDPIGSIQAGLNWIVKSIGVTLGAIQKTLGAVAASVWTALPDWVRGPLEFLRDLAGQAWTVLWNFVRDPVGSIQAGLNWVTTAVTTAFDGAMATVGGWVSDALKGVAEALGGALQGLVTWLGTEIPKAVGVVAKFAQAHIVDPVVGALQWLFGRLASIVRGLISTITAQFAHHSPITPEQALPIGVGVVIAAVGAGALATGLLDVLSTKIVGTGLDLKALGGYITAVVNPGMFMGAVLGVIVGVGIRTPLTQFYNKMFRPAIPAIAEAQRMLWRGKINMGQFRDIVARSGFGGDYEEGYVELTKNIPPWRDLVTMAVREVFPPADFYKYMPLHGFSRMWAEFYWEMHWILLPLGEVRRARHRGIINDSELAKYLVLHDYKPEPRPGMRLSDEEIARRLVWDLPGRIQARWMFRWGIKDRDGLKELLIKGGLDPEHADDVADAVAMNQFLREIRMQETNIKADLRDGYITEATARADLYEIGYPEPFIDYHVKDALKDRERQHKKRLLDIYQDSYLEDLPTEPPFEKAVPEILVDPEAAELFIRETYIRKYKKPKAD